MLTDPAVISASELIALSMTCPHCGGGVTFRANDVIYGRPYGSGYAYICENFPACDSYVGCHDVKANEDQQGKPFGTLADKELREIRKSVHAMIDPYWQGKYISRGRVYQIIARMLDIPSDAAHIGMFDKEQCQTVLDRFYDVLPQDIRHVFLQSSGIIPESNQTE